MIFDIVWTICAVAILIYFFIKFLIDDKKLKRKEDEYNREYFEHLRDYNLYFKSMCIYLENLELQLNDIENAIKGKKFIEEED